MGGYHSTCRSETATLRAIFIAPTKLRIFYRFLPGERYRVGQGTHVWVQTQSVIKKERKINMIEVKFMAEDGGRFGMRMAGHAGAGVRGRDLVCAAASWGAQTLARGVELMGQEGLLAQPPRVHLASGEAEIAAQALGHTREAVALVFWLTQVGLSELARSYPDNLRLAGVLRIHQEE